MKLIVAAFLLAAPFQAVAAPATTLVEVGENDFQINGLSNSDAGIPAVAYNSTDNEYLVVWHATAFRNQDLCPLFPLVSVEEIWGQLLDGATGDPVGGPVRVSTSCDPDLAVRRPDVVYNTTDNEYLVVWQGELEIIDESVGETEIFGQLLSASLAQVGSDDFRISDMGGTGDRDFVAISAAVIHNSTENEYLVVWTGDDHEGGLVDNESEIFGQRLDRDGGELGANDFRISDMGGTGDSDFNALTPAVIHNSTENEYLVVWWGDDDVGGLIDQEVEIFGQRLNENGTEQGANDFRISDMGGTGDGAFDATSPAVTYNSVDNEYLVVWQGDDDVGGLVNGELEIFGQQLNENGGEVGVNDFRISDVGGTGNADYWARNPDVTHNPVANDYLVVWYGDDNEGGLFDDELEIFGQRLDRSGTEQGANDFRISDMGGTGTNPFEARFPALACDLLDSEYLVIWQGDDDENGGLDDEFNIFGQRLRVLRESLFDDGFESGDVSARDSSQ
jgi:hypothetical protein